MQFWTLLPSLFLLMFDARLTFMFFHQPPRPNRSAVRWKRPEMPRRISWGWDAITSDQAQARRSRKIYHTAHVRIRRPLLGNTHNFFKIPKLIAKVINIIHEIYFDIINFTRKSARIFMRRSNGALTRSFVCFCPRQLGDVFWSNLWRCKIFVKRD